MKSLKVRMTSIHLLTGTTMHSRAETPAASAARAFSTARMVRPACTHFDSEGDIKDRLNLVDDRVDLIWSLSHIAPSLVFTILLTGQPMLISTISVLVFSWMNSAARARLSSSLPKSWMDTGFRLHRYEAYVGFFHCCIGYPCQRPFP